MVNEDEIIANLYKSFNQDNVILYIGAEAEKLGELTQQIYSLPWSCIITSVKKDGFGNEFANGRIAHRYTSIEELPINIFSKADLPIIQMFGSETQKPNGTEDIDEFLQDAYIKKHAERILTRVMSKLDIRSRMVVIGYNPNSEQDISLESFIFSCKEIKGGTVEFFNSIEGVDVLKKFAQKNDYTWNEGKLSDAISSTNIEIENDGYTDDKGSTNLFYVAKKPVFIEKSILVRCKNFAQLLTDEKIKEIRPMGRIQLSRWFYNFLNNSSDYPQWYGFLPQSEYYIKREYEDELLFIIKSMLSGHLNTKGGWNTPIVLEGDPGSSKSIELAAIAYKIFCEQNNPVIFINADNLFFSSQSNEIQVLDELMQEVEHVSEKDTRFLIVWDSSSYKNIAMEAKQLAHELENRGRRFVLLCSSYLNVPSESEKQQRKYYYIQDNRLVSDDLANSNIYSYNNCYYVSASRKLSEAEIANIKQKAKLYALAEEAVLNKAWADLAENNDVFEYFYKLIYIIRPKLEAGLSREQRLVNRYVRKQISMLEPSEDVCINPMSEALQRAGIIISNEMKSELESSELDDVYDLDRFNICIAMFSRFKLDTPYNLALGMLCKDSDDYFGSNTSYDNYELFKLLTSQINYLHYCETKDGRYVFRFRNTLEADIFLKNNQINEDRQIEILTEIIDLYINSYRRDNEVDIEMKTAIRSLLKMYGPNTEYREFWPDHSKYAEHVRLLKKLHPLADKLNELRTFYRLPDDDGGMALIEISFYRELYGSMWDRLNGYNKAAASGFEPWEVKPEIYTSESYKLRIERLTDVSNLALESLEKLEMRLLDSKSYLEQRSIQTSINSLTVELASASGEMESIRAEYNRMGSDDETGSRLKPLNYAQLYPILFKAISASPLDGYLYNALFNLFEREYEKADDERKLLLLSDVGMIADDASTLEITSRGSNDKDELGIHLARISQFSCRYVVKIDDIVNGTAPESFRALFEKMLDRNSASGICFICQQELNKAGLDGNSISKYEKETGKDFVLSDEQKQVCQKIVDFINNPEYSGCVDNSIQALYLLLRVEWMLYNGRPLSIGREWQKTYVEQKDWLKIYNTCEKYETISGTSVRPVVTLIYALAKIHIEGDYLGAMKAMHRVSDMPNQRMRVPYLICFEPGIPARFSGTVMSIHNYSGFIKVDGFPHFSEKNQGVKFYMKNLGLRSMPEKNRILKDFGLGLSMANQFSAYDLDGRGDKNE